MPTSRVGGEANPERELTVGGSGSVDVRHFDGFHYVALGHLHGPQHVGRKSVNYAGSILKYSFSESEHKKSASLIEMDEKGGCRVERIPLPAKRDVRVLHGKLVDIMAGATGDPCRGDFIKAVLADEGALFDHERAAPSLSVCARVERGAILATGRLKGLGGDHRPWRWGTSEASVTCAGPT